jgi:hypothetical protein
MKTAYFYDSNKRSAAVPGILGTQISSPSRQHDGCDCSILRASTPAVYIVQICTSTYPMHVHVVVHCMYRTERARACALLRYRGTGHGAEAEHLDLMWPLETQLLTSLLLGQSERAPQTTTKGCPNSTRFGTTRDTGGLRAMLFRHRDDQMHV